MSGPATTTSTEVLLDRLARPYDPTRVVSALLGLTLRGARSLVGSVLACSEEAEALLDAMPHIVRSMAIATTDRPTRCYGELRGPVLWSETMSARSASAGDPGLYVCATTTKAYDTDENRVLKAALDLVRRAGRDADLAHAVGGEEVVRRAHHNGHRAARMLEHQTLSSVPVTRLTGRALRRTRAGSRRTTYRPALTLLRRAAEPVRAEHLAPFLDADTRRLHDLLVEVLDATEAVTGAARPLRGAHGGVAAGPVRFHHPSRTDAERIDGISVAGVPVRAAADVARALEQAPPGLAPS